MQNRIISLSRPPAGGLSPYLILLVTDISSLRDSTSLFKIPCLIFKIFLYPEPGSILDFAVRTSYLSIVLKKSLSLVILISMTLHCSSRLGLLSHLYQVRHSIAYSVGLIAEIPIAVCSSDYDFSKGLQIEVPDSEKGMPGLAQAHEINLFFISAFYLPEPSSVLLSQQLFLRSPGSYGLMPDLSVFHPPSLG